MEKNFWNLITIYFEDPLGIWKKYAKKYFIHPKIRLSTRFEKKVEDAYTNYQTGKIIDIFSSDLGWKNKYDELRYEYDPYFEITLFRHLIFRIDFQAPNYTNNMFDVCYWEGILEMMKNDKMEPADALYLAYKNNQWYKYQSKKSDTIEPFLTNLGRHILDIKKRENLVKSLMEKEAER